MNHVQSEALHNEALKHIVGSVNSPSRYNTAVGGASVAMKSAVLVEPILLETLGLPKKSCFHAFRDYIVRKCSKKTVCMRNWTCARRFPCTGG